MFDLTSTSRSNELHFSESYSRKEPEVAELSTERRSSYSALKSDIDSDMESNSPPSPTSAVSATSENSTTPTTPITTLHQSTWEASENLRKQSALPTFNPAPNMLRRSKKLTSQFCLTPLIDSSLAEVSTHRRRGSLFAARSRTRSPAPKMKIKISTEVVTSTQPVDHDGDVKMLSPPPTNTSQKVIGSETTTTDPAFGATIEIPIRSASRKSDADVSAPEDDCGRRGAVSVERLPPHITINQQPCLSQSSQALGLDLRRRSAYSQARCQQKTHTKSQIQLEIQIPNPLKAQLKNSIQHLGIQLVPLISVTTGLPHPAFPRSLLQYHLLTHGQLDSLARWYHQTVDNTRERFLYPAVVERPWVWSEERARDRNSADFDTEVQGKEKKVLDLALKRRRFGRFIGLRGCESPVLAKELEEHEDEDAYEKDDGEEDLAEEMEREWKAALRRAEEEEQQLEKIWRGRW